MRRYRLGVSKCTFITRYDFWQISRLDGHQFRALSLDYLPDGLLLKMLCRSIIVVGVVVCHAFVVLVPTPDRCVRGDIRNCCT